VHFDPRVRTLPDPLSGGVRLCENDVAYLLCPAVGPYCIDDVAGAVIKQANYEKWCICHYRLPSPHACDDNSTLLSAAIYKPTTLRRLRNRNPSVNPSLTAGRRGFANHDRHPASNA
jgi:hypothetical protein